MTGVFSCICGNILPHQEQQADFKCPNCGRVYNYQGRFLWKEAAGNSLVGSSPIDESEGGGIGKRLEDQIPDPEAAMLALEKAAEEGKLPEEPRRATDEEIDQKEDEAIKALEADRAARKYKKHG